MSTGPDYWDNQHDQRAEQTRAMRDEDPGYRAGVDRIHDEETAAEWEHRRQMRRGISW